jgi:hypothetical protein
MLTSISSILSSKELTQVADVVWKGNDYSESILTPVALVENVHSKNQARNSVSLVAQ